jgi:hypothetical protein
MALSLFPPAASFPSNFTSSYIVNFDMLIRRRNSLKVSLTQVLFSTTCVSQAAEPADILPQSDVGGDAENVYRIELYQIIFFVSVSPG